MPATLYPLSDIKRFEQGAQWEWSMLWFDAADAGRDLSTGWTAEMAVADKHGGAAYFTADQSDEITLADGSDGETDNITIKLLNTDTLKILDKTPYYELRLTRTSDGKVYRLFQGCGECNLMTPAPAG